ncbi:hypothetical protein [Mesorhizobium sp. J18]|uniref:hypothetical protein n=1 Tax=Mesorhizobium sp. J18 TaxID=935263 RepID=UPI0016458521|nr:hypothetical protein [Mesorhizobium sp. J18]
MTAHQKNDDNKWYYRIQRNGDAGPTVGPFPSEQEAIQAGERALAAVVDEEEGQA